MKLDMYSLKARLAPTFILLLPLLLATLAWVPIETSLVKSVTAFAVYIGLFYFMAELGRDQGKAKQTVLFEKWGGKPTTCLLRHRDATLDEVTRNRYHSFLSAAINKRLPSGAEEKADPAAADAIYDSAVIFLLEKTRDESKFPLLLKENTSYGFRRNLWGMKSAGILICLLALAIALVPPSRAILNEAPVSDIALLMAVLILVLFVLWLLRITPSWVRAAANAYGIRLLAACDQIAAATPPQRSLIVTR